MTLFLPGYDGTVWTAARSTLAYANANLNTANLQQSKALGRAVAATLKNAVTAMAANMAYNGLRLLYANLSELVPIPLDIDSTSYSMMLNRINAVQAAAISSESLLVNPLPVAKQLLNSQPVVPDPLYLEWLTSFAFEAPPSGLTAAGLATYAQTEADAWGIVATALRQQSTYYSGTLYNTVILMQQVSQVVANAVANAVVSASTPISQLWNQLVAMPAIGRAVAAMQQDPTDPAFQDTSVARYVIYTALAQFNDMIVALRQVVTAQPRLGILRQGDSLGTLAARELGNYESWRQIAQLNGLQPPYVAATQAPNVAVPGQQLFLPQPNSTTVLSPQTGPVPSYVVNYLGVDKFLGALNEPMLVWTGDYQLVSGYDNLAFSLGRRLQTTVGLLIYHTRFGSRVPPEVGKIASQNELALIVEYSKSCLLSDPRVNKIISCTATSKPNYAIEVNATVLPNGLGQQEVTVNEVIGPA